MELPTLAAQQSCIGGVLAALYGQDPGMTRLVYTAKALWMLGCPDQALARVREAVSMFEGLPNPYSVAMALAYLAMIRQYRREVLALREPVDRLTRLCVEQGYTFWMAWITVFRGWLIAQQGQPEEGISRMRQGLEGWRATGAEAFRPYFLAEGCAKAGRMQEGLTALTEASGSDGHK